MTCSETAHDDANSSSQSSVTIIQGTTTKHSLGERLPSNADNSSQGTTAPLRRDGLSFNCSAGCDKHECTGSKTLTMNSKVGGSRWDPAQQVNFLRLFPGRTPNWEVSTDLVLFTPPWKIIKKLTATDLDVRHSRLIIPKADVRVYILPAMSDETVAMIASKQGITLTVVDQDTSSEHPIVFKYWWGIGSFVLNGQWIDMFVNRRRLQDGDKIGLFWNEYDQKLYFSVLQRGVRRQ